MLWYLLPICWHQNSPARGWLPHNETYESNDDIAGAYILFEPLRHKPCPEKQSCSCKTDLIWRVKGNMNNE